MGAIWTTDRPSSRPVSPTALACCSARRTCLAMDVKTAAEFFDRDLGLLREIAKNLGLQNVEVIGERVVTFLVRWRGRMLRIVMRGKEDYPLSPTSVRFCAEGDPADDLPEHWPAGVSGINAPERFVCSPGFAEGH